MQATGRGDYCCGSGKLFFSTTAVSSVEFKITGYYHHHHRYFLKWPKQQRHRKDHCKVRVTNKQNDLDQLPACLADDNEDIWIRKEMLERTLRSGFSTAN